MFMKNKREVEKYDENKLQNTQKKKRVNSLLWPVTSIHLSFVGEAEVCLVYKDKK